LISESPICGGPIPVKPSVQEDEYFALMEPEIKKRIEAQRGKKVTEDEERKLKELHFVKCPKCGLDPTEIEFKSVKIDECSGCREKWLDAGEYKALVKIEKLVLERLFTIFGR
jgi:uncharacterized protein